MPTTRQRLSPEERKLQLLRVAAGLLHEEGPDGVQVGAVASAAGVTRPVVYRFFANRQALILGVLEAFVGDVGQRFVARSKAGLAAGLVDGARIFVAAMCDAVDEWGAGPWHLLAARGPDPETARVARELMERMIGPWRGAIANATGATGPDAPEVTTVTAMLVASGRAAIDLWLEGVLDREAAMRDAARGIGALLREFGARGAR